MNLATIDRIMSNPFWFRVYSGMLDAIVGYMVESIKRFI